LAELACKVPPAVDDAADDQLAGGRPIEDEVLPDGVAAQPTGNLVSLPAYAGEAGEYVERVVDLLRIGVCLPPPPVLFALLHDVGEVVFRFGSESYPTV
jgi:hypothetical protein